MEVLDRALFRHVSGAGSTEPVQKPISSTIKDGVQVDKFDLGNGGIAIVTCTGVTVSLSLGLQGKKLIDLNGGFGTTVTSCKITTIDKDGKIIDQKNADASDVDKGDVQIAENGTVEDSGDGSSGDTGSSGGAGDTSDTGDTGSGDTGGGDAGGGDAGGGDAGGGDAGGGGGGGGGGDKPIYEEQD